LFEAIDQYTLAMSIRDMQRVTLIVYA